MHAIAAETIARDRMRDRRAADTRAQLLASLVARRRRARLAALGCAIANLRSAVAPRPAPATCGC